MERRLQGIGLVLGQAHGREGACSSPSSAIPPPPSPPPPPPPPPPPAAKAGHFTGKTADNELWAFDITSDGLSLTNLQTGQLNESCNPPDFTLAGGQQTLRGPFPVARDGSFSINLSTSTSIDGTPGTDTLVITGQISGGVATGTYRDDTAFSSNGTAYSCTTGNQTWSAAWTS